MVDGGSPRKSSRQPHDTQLPQHTRNENTPLNELLQIRNMVTHAARAGSEAMLDMVKSELRSVMDEAIGKMSTSTPSTELCDVAEEVQIKHVYGDPSPDKKKDRVEKAKCSNKSLGEREDNQPVPLPYL